MQLGYESLFTCTHADCLGRAYRHRQAHTDSCITIGDPDSPFQVGDIVSHRRSCHPGTVVAVPNGADVRMRNRILVRFEGQEVGDSQPIHRRELKKRPRVHFLPQHQRCHIRFILKRLAELHDTLDHRTPGEHYQKVCI